MEALLERGQPPPAWFDEEPQLEVGDDFYLRAFWELSTERQIGWSSGPIPHSSILGYGERAELESSTMGLFVQVIRSMDAAYLGWLAKERERLSKTKE